MPRRFPLRWTAKQIPGSYVVKDATGQSLAYVYGAQIAGLATKMTGCERLNCADDRFRVQSI